MIWNEPFLIMTTLYQLLYHTLIPAILTTVLPHRHLTWYRNRPRPGVLHFAASAHVSGSCEGLAEAAACLSPARPCLLQPSTTSLLQWYTQSSLGTGMMEGRMLVGHFHLFAVAWKYFLTKPNCLEIRSC